MVIPPWIQAADPAAWYNRGVQINQAQQELGQRAQQFEQQSRMKQHELEITKAAHEMDLKYKQDQLTEEKRMNDLKVQEASRKAAAMMEAQRRIRAGEDPDKVWMELGPLALPAAAEAAYVRESTRKAAMQQPTWVPPDPATGAPGYFRTGTGMQIPSSTLMNPPMEEADKIALNELYRRLSKIDEELSIPGIKDAQAKALRDQQRNVQRQINEFRLQNKNKPQQFQTADRKVMVNPKTNKWDEYMQDPATGEWVSVSEIQAGVPGSMGTAGAATAQEPQSGVPFWPVFKTAFATYPPGLQY